MMKKESTMLLTHLERLALQEEDRACVVLAMEVLENQFGVSKKTADEPETLDIIQQMFERLFARFGQLSRVKKKRILDIACGSRTSREPWKGFRLGQPKRRGAERSSHDGYTALFEPWLCRILSALDAQPVGIDIGDLSGESFECHQADLGRAGALDFLPHHSFDAVHDSRLFGSPEFTARFPDRAEALRIAREIVRQETRLLKEGGIIIHSDAHRLIGE
jgi:hypothetical protein